jgi:hypothetical protein
MGLLPEISKATTENRLDSLLTGYFAETKAKTMHLPATMGMKIVATKDVDFLKVIFTDLGTNLLVLASLRRVGDLTCFNHRHIHSSPWIQGAIHVYFSLRLAGHTGNDLEASPQACPVCFPP